MRQMSAPGDKGDPKGAARAATMVRGSPPPVPREAMAKSDTLAPTDISADVQLDEGSLLDLQAGTIVGEYRIEGRLGEGGMATVYSAIHPLIGKRAAIKVMSQVLSADAAAVERFVQEARAVNQIGHPNIVDVFAFGTLPDGRSYFVMEWLSGETLHARMERDPLKLRETIAILFDICDALDAAHEKDIVHRDLKPENIFLVSLRNNRRQVKLLDFGVAKLNKTADARLQRTRQDTIIGTPHYLSPEQARAKDVDHRTDVYSLGIMAFEMCTGRVPFDADNVVDILLQHVSGQAAKPSSIRAGLPERLDELLLQMLSKEPDKRPSLDEVRGGLAFVRDTVPLEREGFLGPVDEGGRPSSVDRATPIHTARPTPTPSSQETGAIPAVPPRQGRGWLVPAIAVGFLAVGGGAFVATRKPAVPPAVIAPMPAAVIPTPAPPPVAPSPTPPVAKPGLRVTVNAPDATITVDDKVVADKAGAATVTLEAAGAHVVQATAPGRKPARKIVTLKNGETQDVALTLPKASTGKSTTKKNSDYMLDPFGR